MDIHDAIVTAGIDRGALIAGINRTFVQTIPTVSSHSAQVLVDLHELNRIERLLDGTLPLRTYLLNAIRLSGSRSQGLLLAQALSAAEREMFADHPEPSSAMGEQRARRFGTNPSEQPAVPSDDEHKKDSAKFAFQRGSDLADKSRWEEAVRYFREADDLVPGAMPKFKIAQCLDRLGQQVEAQKQYDAFLAIAPTHNDTYEDKIATALERSRALSTLMALAQGNGNINESPVSMQGNETKSLRQVRFETKSAEILGDSITLLQEVAERLIRNPSIKKLEIQGHTDNTGIKDANLTLSQQRADAVRSFLIAQGVAASRLLARGYGQERPLAPNITEANRAKNRRVQFIILEGVGALW